MASLVYFYLLQLHAAIIYIQFTMCSLALGSKVKSHNIIEHTVLALIIGML